MSRKGRQRNTSRFVNHKTSLSDVSKIEQSYYKPNNSNVKFVVPNNEQKNLIRSINNNSITLVSGDPGTGKTLFSIQTLFQMLKAKTIDKIIIVRLMCEDKEENIGARPGDLKDKTEDYMHPIRDNLKLFVCEGEINFLIEKGIIEIVPYSLLRGRTLSNMGIIIEEAQNLTRRQIMTAVTRIGNNSRMILNGDDAQNDIKGRRGISFLKKLLSGINDVGVIKFVSKMNSRHPLIADLVERDREIGDEY